MGKRALETLTESTFHVIYYFCQRIFTNETGNQRQRHWIISLLLPHFAHFLITSRTGNAAKVMLIERNKGGIKYIGNHSWKLEGY